MRRSTASRAIALLLATLVGVSAPAVALGHGHAHGEAAAHAEHGRDHHHGTTHSPVADLTVAVGPADDAGDHGHPQLSLVRMTRADAPLFVPADAVALPVFVLLESRVSLLLSATLLRAAPPDAPLRQPRAPPLG